MSLKLQLLEKIKSEKKLWHKGELSDYARDLGYSSENAGRRLRELEKAKIIKNKLDKKGCVWYYIEEYSPVDKPKIQFGNSSQIYALKQNKNIWS